MKACTLSTAGMPSHRAGLSELARLTIGTKWRVQELLRPPRFRSRCRHRWDGRAPAKLRATLLKWLRAYKAG